MTPLPTRLLGAWCRPATVEDAAAVAEHMRPADAAELWAASEQTPLEGAVESVEATPPGRSGALWLGRPGAWEHAGVFGVVPEAGNPSRAFPWLLTTLAVERHPRPFWRASQAWIATWRRDFEVLENAIDARHTVALRWAARLGFEVGPAEPFGMLRLPFHRITIRRS